MNVNVTPLVRALPPVRKALAWRGKPPAGWRFTRVDLHPGAVVLEMEGRD